MRSIVSSHEIYICPCCQIDFLNVKDGRYVPSGYRFCQNCTNTEKWHTECQNIIVYGYYSSVPCGCKRLSDCEYCAKCLQVLFGSIEEYHKSKQQGFIKPVPSKTPPVDDTIVAEPCGIPDHYVIISADLAGIVIRKSDSEDLITVVGKIPPYVSNFWELTVITDLVALSDIEAMQASFDINQAPKIDFVSRMDTLD